MKRWLRKTAVYGILPLAASIASLWTFPYCFEQYAKKHDSDRKAEFAAQLQDAPGWKSVDIPLDPNPNRTRELEETLAADDRVQRALLKNDDHVLIYAEHWNSQRIRYGLSHTPDACWSKLEKDVSKDNDNYVLQLGDQKSFPGYYREFNVEGKKIHVAWWLVHNGTPVHQYVGGGPHRGTARIEDLLRYGLYQSEPTDYVRISSDIPFEILMKDPNLVKSFLSLKDDQNKPIIKETGKREHCFYFAFFEPLDKAVIWARNQYLQMVPRVK